MFSRKRQAKPLKAVPLKFVKQGENLDIANSIMSVEMSAEKTTKTPKVSRRKASTMSSQRRSASIERIFEKQKTGEEKVKIELQKQLQDLRQKEQELKRVPQSAAPKAACIPPPPPPPAPAKVAANLPPPPPPPPAAMLKAKPRTIAPGKTIAPTQKKVQTASTPAIHIEQSAILDIRSRLRKVNRETPNSEAKPAPAQQENIQDKVVELLKQRMAQIRVHIKESDDSDDESSESSSSEDF